MKIEGMGGRNFRVEKKKILQEWFGWYLLTMIQILRQELERWVEFWEEIQFRLCLRSKQAMEKLKNRCVWSFDNNNVSRIKFDFKPRPFNRIHQTFNAFYFHGHITHNNFNILAVSDNKSVINHLLVTFWLFIYYSFRIESWVWAINVLH